MLIRIIDPKVVVIIEVPIDRGTRIMESGTMKSHCRREELVYTNRRTACRENRHHEPHDIKSLKEK